MLSILLTSIMLMFSDRSNFWEGSRLSSHTQYAEVNENGITKFINEAELEKLQGRRVLILVHGFATVNVCYPYFNIQVNILGSRSPYDLVIGYLWPCHGNHLNYLEAKKTLIKVAPRFSHLLEKLQSLAVRVDVVAHSLGNRLVLQALKTKGVDRPLIDNFILIAPAINSCSIHKNREFYHSTKLCNHLYVFYSENDRVLKWAYPITEWNKALGYEGNINYHKLPPNVQMVDCTAIIDSHNAYLFSKPLFAYVQQVAGALYPTPQVAQHINFTQAGMYEILKWRESYN